jgi:precorrin-2/cobalt-factor-2 C20-methyltransferase
VGVGPGDPELMTLKAWRLVSTAPVIAYLAANGKDSTARDIASPFIPEDATHLVIDMPMRTEREPGERAYDQGAAAIATHLRDGRDVVMLCEGDPFFYGSFMHLYTRLRDRCPVEVVPGITGMSGCWTATGEPITWGDDVLTVVTATMREADLARRARETDALVVMKIGRNLEKLKRALGAAGRLNDAWLVERGTMPDQRVHRLSEVPERVPYFSIVVVHGRGRRP